MNTDPSAHRDPNPMAALVQLVEALQDDIAELRREVRQQHRQLEALFSLFSVLQPRSALPPLGGWRIAPDFAVVLMNLIQAERPRTVVELGGGASTIVTAYALERWNPGEGRVVGLEHQREFATTANERLQQHGFAAQRARVLHAPLQPLGHPAYAELQDWEWYDLRSLKSMSQIELLVVDGPPQYGNPTPMARYPALPVLRDLLARGALILLDDTGREDEQRVLGRWLNELPLQIVEEYDVEKGAVLLRWNAS